MPHKDSEEATSPLDFDGSGVELEEVGVNVRVTPSSAFMPHRAVESQIFT